MIDSNGKFLPEEYVAEQFGVPSSIMLGASICNLIDSRHGWMLNVCVDYPGLTDDVKLLRKLKNKKFDCECYCENTGDRQRYFSFLAAGDAFWLHFGS